MSAAQELNYVINAASYLRAAKKGMKQNTQEERVDNEYDRDIGNEYDFQPITARRRNISSSLSTSSTKKSLVRRQKRNQNRVTWTDQDRATAAQAAAIAIEVAAEAAKLAEGKNKKEKSTPYWTRYQEKNRSNVRFQKEMGRVAQVDSYGYD